MTERIVVVGAGAFGLAAALELRDRGYEVVVFDPGPIPHPLAASTDISKVVRMEYGPDETYMALGEEAREGWLRWNDEWRGEGASPLYHETGVLMVCREPMAPGGFEYESWRLLRARGHRPERLTAEALARRFPAWRTGLYVDGFYHAEGGYAESGRVVEALARWAALAGVELAAGQRVAGLVGDRGRVRGVRDPAGDRVAADHVVVAAGAWVGKLVPELADLIPPTGQPVFHLAPPDPAPFAPERFPVYTADIARTGFYGFPATRDGIVKVAHHGVGRTLDPDGPREVTGRDHERLQRFLEETFPDLVEAPVAATRVCLYADTPDGDFWIAGDPARPGLTVAGGGSGHGFKFAPVLGPIIADCVEGVPNRWLERFRWRPEVRGRQGGEAARCKNE